jgi:hypothetical protein
MYQGHYPPDMHAPGTKLHPSTNSAVDGAVGRMPTPRSGQPISTRHPRIARGPPFQTQRLPSTHPSSLPQCLVVHDARECLARSNVTPPLETVSRHDIRQKIVNPFAFLQIKHVGERYCYCASGRHCAASIGEGVVLASEPSEPVAETVLAAEALADADTSRSRWYFAIADIILSCLLRASLFFT